MVSDTLVGVLVGAVITGGFAWLVAWWNKRSDNAAELRRHGMEVQRAARLIDADLQVAVAAALLCVKTKEWWGTQPLTSQGWQQYRAAIAPELSAGAWTALMTAVIAIDHLQWSRDAAAKIHRAKMATDPAKADVMKAAAMLDLDIIEPVAMSEANQQHVEKVLKDLEAGRAALAPLTS